MSFFKFFAVDKWARLARIYKQNGGLAKNLYKLWRFDTVKEGCLVGWDTFGNRYYENNYYQFGRNRWVEFSIDVRWNMDASQVTPEWFGWLHYKTDKVPCEDESKRDLYCSPYTSKWLKPHEENLTGSDRAFYPYSTVPRRIYVWDGESLVDRMRG